MTPDAPERRRFLARPSAARRAVARIRAAIRPPSDTTTAPARFDELAPEAAVRLAYQVILGRDPDPVGRADYGGRLAAGALSPDGLVEELLISDEFEARRAYPGRYLHVSIHASRRDFIRSLPPARRILDLGGGWKWSAEGALVVLGYPYAFEDLVIVDLPSDDRHPLYRSQDHAATATRLGPVRYDYRSMSDLSGHPDGAYDLVYSGQSIEHVSPGEGDVVLKEAYRVLRPGGFLALDTPNAAVCRLQQPEFIDADHKVEYTHEEMRAKLTAAGFSLVEEKGLNYCGESVRTGVFSWEEAARNRGVYGSPADCYLLAYLATKA
jgi:ubiquinone/menaquinone biosynthesis C-methylase UbiE